MSEEEEPKEIKLGFGASPDELTMIFVGGDEGDESGSCWYTRNFDKEINIPLESKAITGYINGVVISKSEFKGKANYKLNIRLRADKRYQIRAGLNTFFSRGFILAFKQFLDDGGDPKDEPITISVRQGNDGKVVFCSLFTPEDNRKIFVEWDGDSPVVPIVNKIQEQMGITVQTKDMIENPDKYRDQPVRQPKLRDMTGPPTDEEAERMADDIFGPPAKDKEEEETPRRRKKK